MDTSFCIGALDDALVRATPEILNTDQGSQFTSEAFADRVLGAGVAFSMDGRGRFLDNIFIERLWRSLKYEAVYLHELRGGLDAETHHRVVDRLLQRGAPAFVPGRAHPGRRLPQRHGGTVNAATSHVPGRALVSRRGRGATRDLPIPGASRRRPPGPARRSAFPPGERGSYWSLSFPCRERIAGWSIHPKQTQSESYRGLSQPLGIHLNYALGLSNEVGPPHTPQPTTHCGR